jgi:hypothetical protein
MLGRAGLDSYDKSKLKTNADGSVDPYFGNSAPRDYESNWLPPAGEDFFVIFRPGLSTRKPGGCPISSESSPE